MLVRTNRNRHFQNMIIKVLLLGLLLLVSSFCNAQNKKFDKIIEEYDVKPYIESLKKGDAKAFWTAIYSNDKDLSTLVDAMQKKKSSALESVRKVNEGVAPTEAYYNQIIRTDGNWSVLADTINNFLGITSVFPNFNVHIIKDDFLNACATPNGNVYITDSLVLAPCTDMSSLMGIAAHEATHSLLQHIRVRMYKTQKKYNRNKAVAGIAAGLNILSNGYAQANGAATNESWESVEKNNSDLFEEVDYNTNVKYKFKYERNQELQADIVAYRFLQFMGYDADDYIKELNFLGKAEDVGETKDDDTHPTTKFRVDLLNYLKTK